MAAQGSPRRAYSGLIAALQVLLLASWLVLVPGVSPARAEVNAGGLRLERPVGSVQVEFGPSVAGRREGTFTLLLRNTSSVALRPRLTLDPAEDSSSLEGAPVLYLHLFGSAGGSVWLRSVGKVPTIAPLGVGRVALVVGLPAASDPDSIDGTLVLHAVNSSLVAHGRPALLPIAASELDLSRVQAVPSVVALHTTAWLPGGHSASGTEADFDLRGLGVQALADSGHLNGQALLHSSDGRTVLARVGIKREAGESRPVLRLIGVAAAGTYAGTVPLSSSSWAPSLSVTLSAHDEIVWTLLAVAAGAFLGGLLPLLGKRARRRNFLRARLQGALLEYLPIKSGDSLMKWTGLSIAIGPDPAPWTSTEWLAQPALRGAAGLFSRLHWAQSETDLDELTSAIEKLVSRIEAWIRLQPKVRELEQISRVEVPPIAGASWSSTATSVASGQLWMRVAGGEVEPTEAEQQAVLLEEQTLWHGEVAGAWQQLAKAWADIEEPLRADLLARLVAVASAQASSITPGIDEERTELRWKLAGVVTDLAALPGVELDDRVPMAQYLQDRPAKSGQAVQGLWHALWKWTTGLVPRLTTRVKRLLVRSKPARLMAAARRQDIMLSIVAALGAMLVYTLQIYTATWGSLTDYLTAIAAGFGAQAVVRWAALPIFESWRERSADVDDSKSPPAATPGSPSPSPSPAPAPAAHAGGGAQG
jgi:hypothetical protein